VNNNGWCVDVADFATAPLLLQQSLPSTTGRTRSAEATLVARPLPRFACSLPVLTEKFQYLGLN